MTNNDKHDNLELMQHVDRLCGPSCGYCMFQSLDYSRSTSQFTYSTDLPIAGHDRMSGRYSCFDAPAGTEVQGTALEEDRAHWSINSGEDQSLMSHEHNIVQSTVYEYDELESMRSSTGFRASSMNMGVIENVNPFLFTSLYDRRGSLHAPETPGSQGSFDQLFGATPPTFMSVLSHDFLASPHPFYSYSRSAPLFLPNVPTINTLGTIEGTGNLGVLVFRCGARSYISKTFNRWQDFTRHYNGAHAPPDAGNMFWCAVPGCDRGIRPFPRKDKLNDHVRKVHMLVVESASSDMLGG